MLVSVYDMISRNVLQPIAGSLIITDKVFLSRTLENCNIKVFRVKFKNVNKILPCHVNSTFFEVITKRPVTQHLEHCVMIGVVSHLFKVVVFAAYAETLLAVGTTAGFWIASTQDDVFPLIHSSIGEHQSRVILYHHGGRRNYQMSFCLKELLE